MAQSFSRIWYWQACTLGLAQLPDVSGVILPLVMPVLIHQQKQAALSCDSSSSECIVLLPCLSCLGLSTVTRSPFDGSRTCFPSQVCFSARHTGLQETLPCFWLSSPWASLYAHVRTLYFLCLFQFSAASRRPATDPSPDKEHTPELFCLGLRHLSVNATNVIPYRCSTKKLHFVGKSDSSRSFFYSV